MDEYTADAFDAEEPGPDAEGYDSDFVPQDGPDLFGESVDEPAGEPGTGSADVPRIEPADTSADMPALSQDSSVEAESQLALYRRYRPETFAEVIGQEHVTDPLQRALTNNRVNHAYLFSGPRGCGKTSSARILARALNCESGPTPTPCGTCRSCRDLARNGPGSIDVIEIDAASHGGVDDARELRERAFFAPVQSRFKIYIVDEAHMVTPAGFNALLKLVEEPPPHVKFVFATTEPDKVIGTIRSRTHHYPFRLVPPRTLGAYLGQLCEAEGVEVDPTVLPLVVRAGAGSVRDSLSVLDQLLGAADAGQVSYEHAATLLGFTPDSLLDELVDAVAASDGAELFATLDRVIEAGQDPKRFAEDLLRRWRDLVIVASVPDATTSGLVDVAPDQAERLNKQAEAMGLAKLTRAGEIMAAGLAEMRGTTSPRLFLELMCARILIPEAAADTSDLLARIERLERRVESAGEPPRRASREIREARRQPESQSAASAASSPDPGRSNQHGGQSAEPSKPPRTQAPEATNVPKPAQQSGAPGTAAPTGRPRGRLVLDDPLTTAPKLEAPKAPAGKPSEPAVPPTPQPGRPGSEPAAAHRPTEDSAAPAAPQRQPQTTAPQQPQQTTPAAAPKQPQEPAPVTPGGELTTSDVRRMWPQVMEHLQRKRRFTWMLINQNAQVESVSDNTLTLNFVAEAARDRFGHGGSADLLAEAMIEVLGIELAVRTTVGGQSQPTPQKDQRPGGGASRAAPADPPGDRPAQQSPSMPPSGQGSTAQQTAQQNPQGNPAAPDQSREPKPAPRPTPQALTHGRPPVSPPAAPAAPEGASPYQRPARKDRPQTSQPSAGPRSAATPPDEEPAEFPLGGETLRDRTARSRAPEVDEDDFVDPETDPDIDDVGMTAAELLQQALGAEKIPDDGM